MVTPSLKCESITKFLKPYVLKMQVTNKYISAQVVHEPSDTMASFASSQEKSLRATIGSTSDVSAAKKIGKILGERLLIRNISAVTVALDGDQKYCGKVRALIDSLRKVGVKLI
ncbi:hypothetical protein Scep_030724 [Stephania cephalantha]|uniref:50S ribosomal protein L18 n=1 Tax=Stephania cephalantha TaxID=152367 RepID=A0AAP0HDE4_9MAGN